MRRAREEAGPGVDPIAQRLSKRNAKLGNDTMQQLLGQGNSSRDELLRFITRRLHSMRQFQKRELELSTHDAQREWWRDVGDQQEERYAKPEPARWGEAAHLYDEAMRQLCSGQLGQGSQLLERAVAEEERTHEQAGELVGENFPEIEREPPPELDEILPNQAAGSCELPEEARRLADEIQRVTTEIDDPPNRKRRRDPWWTLEEEDDDEEDEDASGGG